MNDDTDLDSDAQTYNDDAYLGEAHYAAPQTVACDTSLLPTVRGTATPHAASMSVNPSFDVE